MVGRYDIWRYWTGLDPDPFPQFAGLWRQLHPDWTVHDLTDEDLAPDVRAWVDRNEYLCPADDAGRQRGNLVRWRLLAEHGGVWVDADLEPLKPVGPLVAGGPFIAGGRAPRPELGFVGVPPGHGFAVEACTKIRSGCNAPESSGARVADEVLRNHPDVRRLPLYADGWVRHHWHTTKRRKKGSL